MNVLAPTPAITARPGPDRVRVAGERDGVLDLLTVAIKDMSVSVRRNARMIITGPCDEAVKAGRSASTGWTGSS
jgi:hypothetical protein